MNKGNQALYHGLIFYAIIPAIAFCSLISVFMLLGALDERDQINDEQNARVTYFKRLLDHYERDNAKMRDQLNTKAMSCTVTMSAYNSEARQTDSSPCITASNMNVCERNREDVVAANFLPLHSIIKIPELYGDQEFHVEDRMNRRYQNNVDIWMRDRQDAIQFGRQHGVEIQIIRIGRDEIPYTN